MGKLKKLLPNIIVIVILIAGIGLLTYPTISDYINELHSTRAIGSYVEKTKDLSKEEKERLLKEARKYNESLVNKPNHYFLTKEEEKQYNQILDITGTGIMAYVEIPKIKVQMPIYHGTNQGVLEVAVGHIQGSSLPVGGPSTHSLLSGHRGLPSAKLFTDIDQLKNGDMFYIHVFDEILAYKVDKIDTVLPDEVGSLEIEKGKDYVTLITCTPYGVNTHRLLVRGVRTSYRKSKNKSNNQVNKDYIHLIIIAAIAVFMMIFLTTIWLVRKKRRKAYEK